MKRKQLQGILETLEPFDKPDIRLEQYTTGVSLTIDILNYIKESGDISECLIADLGCGTGILTAGALLMGASHSVAIDIDETALQTCQSNLYDIDLFDRVDVIQCDVTKYTPFTHNSHAIDTVIMNPPFGTKTNPGVDVKFVKAAISLEPKVIYSMHKTSTRKHMIKIGGDFGATCDVIAELRFDLPSTYKFHKRNSLNIDVDLLKFTVGQ